MMPSGARDAFLAAVSPRSPFHGLFDDLPEVCFFVKDAQGRHWAASRALLRRYGMDREREILGKTDQELLPRALAEKYRADDRRVMATRRPMSGVIELFLDARGVPTWHVVDKRPVLGRDGRVIGIMGISRRSEAHPEPGLTGRRMRRIYALIRERCAERLSIRDLARRAGLSPRQLERRFRAELWMSPRELIQRMRVERACEALRNTEHSMARIALDCGFYDQAAFTRQFKKRLGLTPGQYRRRFG